VKILAIIIFLISSFLLISINSVEGSEVESFSVPAGGVQTFWFNLESGDSVSGSMSIAGGDDDINFWVTDPSGQLIIPKQGVVGGKNFQFTAVRNGAHTLHFDNSFSIFTGKVVTLTYEIEYAIGGGCLIATATYGSEQSSQVQMLREIRDNSLLQTQSGQSFMESFNSFYYSFSPTIADYERQNPVFKEAVKLAITPLLVSLSLLNHVNLNSEESVLGYGIGIIIMNIGMYFVAPTFVIYKIRNSRLL